MNTVRVICDDPPVDEEAIPISEFADWTNRSITSARHLVQDGNSIRRLKTVRIRHTYYIPIKELYGFPLVRQGQFTSIYHYVKVDENIADNVPILEAQFCEKCTFARKQADLEKDERTADGRYVISDWCEPRKTAERLVTPIPTNDSFVKRQ